MKGKSFLISVILIIFGSHNLLSQQNDFQAWPSLQVNLEIFDNFRIHLEEEIRLHENLSQVSRQINDAGISYRLNKYMKAGIFYRVEADWKNADEYSWRKGVYGDIALRNEFDRFTFGYRFRVQSSKVERADTETNLFSGFRHRHKVSASYDIKGIPLAPFAEGELFVDQSGQKQSGIAGLRTWIGLEYTIQKIHTVTLKYGIDQEIHTNDPIRAYIIALGYSVDLSLQSK